MFYIALKYIWTVNSHYNPIVYVYACIHDVTYSFEGLVHIFSDQATASCIAFYMNNQICGKGPYMYISPNFNVISLYATT